MSKVGESTFEQVCARHPSPKYSNTKAVNHDFDLRKEGSGNIAVCVALEFIEGKHPGQRARFSLRVNARQRETPPQLLQNRIFWPFQSL